MKNWPKKRNIDGYVSILRTIFRQIWNKRGCSLFNPNIVELTIKPFLNRILASAGKLFSGVIVHRYLYYLIDCLMVFQDWDSKSVGGDASGSKC